MGNKKTTNPNVRELAHRGRRSIGITFPMEMMKELKWRPGKKVVVKKIKGGLAVMDVKK